MQKSLLEQYKQDMDEKVQSYEKNESLQNASRQFFSDGYLKRVKK